MSCFEYVRRGRSVGPTRCLLGDGRCDSKVNGDTAILGFTSFPTLGPSANAGTSQKPKRAREAHQLGGTQRRMYRGSSLGRQGNAESRTCTPGAIRAPAPPARVDASCPKEINFPVRRARVLYLFCT